MDSFADVTEAPAENPLALGGSATGGLLTPTIVDSG
jgi:hypothetical protein